MGFDDTDLLSEIDSAKDLLGAGRGIGPSDVELELRSSTSSAKEAQIGTSGSAEKHDIATPRPNSLKVDIYTPRHPKMDSVEEEDEMKGLKDVEDMDSF